MILSLSHLYDIGLRQNILVVCLRLFGDFESYVSSIPFIYDAIGIK